MLGTIVTGPGVALATDPPPAPGQADEPTPARVSYIHGEVSFWRPGAEEWTAATLNTPLAPGDLLYTGEGGQVEIQFGPRAFLRAGESSQIGLDNHEPDFIQFRMTAGHGALDVRQLASGHTVELATPNAAFTVERAGYYRVDVAEDSTTFRAHRGGSATMTAAGGTSTPIAANQQIVVTGTDTPHVEMGAAPALTAWDRWNYQRTDYLLQSATARYVSPSVYGTEALDQHGSWRTVDTYGPVWVPTSVPAGWVPYSTGRWIWDPRFGWTWLDDAPWGWAPYHYGRWVFVRNYWAWAPGPVVVRPAYAPALVVFLGGGVSISVGRPLYWAPLGWGEPVVRWWGRPGFVGTVWWGGWGGPRVVNNVVVKRTTNINVTNITVYKNVHVTNAVVAVPAERFGHGQVRPTRVEHVKVRELRPVRGAPEVKPVAASVMLAGRSAAKPPAAIRTRQVVATRAPRDFTPALREHGLGAAREEAAPRTAPRLVPAPKSATRRGDDDARPEARPKAAPNIRPVAPNSGASKTGEAARGAPRRPDDKARAPEDKARGPQEKARGPAEKAGGREDQARGPEGKAPGPGDKARAPQDRLRAPENKARGVGDKPRGSEGKTRQLDQNRGKAVAPPEPRQGNRPAVDGERDRRQAAPLPRSLPPDTATPRQAPPLPQAQQQQQSVSPRQRQDVAPQPQGGRAGDPRGRADTQERGDPSPRTNQRSEKKDARPDR